jgi:hypothetical protein
LYEDESEKAQQLQPAGLDGGDGAGDDDKSESSVENILFVENPQKVVGVASAAPKSGTSADGGIGEGAAAVEGEGVGEEAGVALTQKNLAGGNLSKEQQYSKLAGADRSCNPPTGTSTSYPTTTINFSKQENAEDEEADEDELELGFWNCVVWLAALAVVIALVSDAITYSVEEAAESMGISKVFIAAIILPIVGNAAEHAGAVLFAMKGKMDLALAVAVGSSTQIALCVLPLLVILGWMGGSDLSLNFGGFESITLFLTVISVTFAIKDGQSNWLLGMTLVAAYFVVAIGFWAHDNEDLSNR